MTAGGTAGVAMVTLASTLGTALLALTAAAWTGSAALLALAVAALVGVSSQGLLLWGPRRTEANRNELHFWSFVVAILLFSLGAGVALAEGVGRLLDPRPATDPLIATAALVLAFLIQGTSAATAIAELNRRRGATPVLAALRDIKDPALFTIVVESTALLAGVALAAAGLGVSRATGSPAPDAGAAVAIGLLLGAVAIVMSIEVRRSLAGEAAPAAKPSPAATKGESTKERKRRKPSKRP